MTKEKEEHRTEVLSARTTKSLTEQIAELAKKDNRTPGNMIESLIMVGLQHYKPGQPVIERKNYIEDRLYKWLGLMKQIKEKSVIYITIEFDAEGFGHICMEKADKSQRKIVFVNLIEAESRLIELANE